jgi:hypothetical protein
MQSFGEQNYIVNVNFILILFKAEMFRFQSSYSCESIYLIVFSNPTQLFYLISEKSTLHTMIYHLLLGAYLVKDKAPIMYLAEP